MDIAHFGEPMKPRLSAIKPEKLSAISDLLTVRSQCLEMSTMQTNRLKRLPKSVHKPIQNILKSIKQGIESIDKPLGQLVDSVAQWRQRRDLLLSAKGVGNVLAYTLMSELPEPGNLNRKEIATLVGVAPTHSTEYFLFNCSKREFWGNFLFLSIPSLRNTSFHRCTA